MTAGHLHCHLHRYFIPCVVIFLSFPSEAVDRRKVRRLKFPETQLKASLKFNHYNQSKALLRRKKN